MSLDRESLLARLRKHELRKSEKDFTFLKKSLFSIRARRESPKILQKIRHQKEKKLYF
jgi:hypothetical protein